MDRSEATQHMGMGPGGIAPVALAFRPFGKGIVCSALTAVKQYLCVADASGLVVALRGKEPFCKVL